MTAKDINEDQDIEAADTEDIEALQQALAEERDKAEANLAGWQRTQGGRRRTS